MEPQSVLIENSVFLRNGSSAGGGGVSIGHCQQGAIRFNTFAFDSSSSGGGIQLSWSSVTVENNTFVGRHGELAAAAISVGANAAGVRNNAGGDYFDEWTPADSDIYADPESCDLVAGDCTLRSISPAVPANAPDCGLVGAHDVGCGTVSVSVESSSWGRIKGMYRPEAGR